MSNLLLVHCLAAGLTFGIHASESGSTGTLTSKTETRTISTTETRNPNPDGSLSGTFSQLIKGTKDQEKILIKGSIQKVDDKETFTLDEQGKNALGQAQDNSVTITRD